MLVSLFALIVYTGLAFAYFHLTWEDPAHRLIGGCCDAPSAAWFLRWTGFALSHNLNVLVSNYAGIWSGFNVMWQPPAMPLVGAVVWPLETFLGPFISYNLVVTMAMSTSGWACYIAMRRWVGGYVGPFIAGLAFCFSAYITAHAVGHPQFMALAPSVFFLLILSDLLIYRKRLYWRSGIALGIVGAGQFLISQETFADMLIVSIVIVGTVWLFQKRTFLQHLRSTVTALSLSAAICAAFLAWPLSVEFFGPEQLHGLLRPQNFFVTDLANLVLPNPWTSQFHPFGGTYAFQWQWVLSEMGAFIGVPLLVFIMVVFVRCRHDPFVLICGTSALIVLLLSLGPSLHVAGHDLHVPLPWWPIEHLPLLESALPVRLDAFWQLGVCGLTAVGVREIASIRKLRKRAVGFILVAICLVPLLPTFDYWTWEPEVPAFFTTAAVKQIPQGATVFVVPFPRDQIYDVDPMVWQLFANMRFRMPGGYVFFPSPFGPGLAVTGGAEDALTLRLDDIAEGKKLPTLSRPDLMYMRSILFSKYRPQYALVGPMPGERAALELMTGVLEERPTYVEGVYLWKLQRTSAGSHYCPQDKCHKY